VMPNDMCQVPNSSSVGHSIKAAWLGLFFVTICGCRVVETV
jgi:hypothetical protein